MQPAGTISASDMQPLLPAVKCVESCPALLSCAFLRSFILCSRTGWFHV